MYFLFNLSKWQRNNRRLIPSFDCRCLHQQSHTESVHLKQHSQGTVCNRINTFTSVTFTFSHYCSSCDPWNTETYYSSPFPSLLGSSPYQTFFITAKVVLPVYFGSCISVCPIICTFLLWLLGILSNWKWCDIWVDSKCIMFMLDIVKSSSDVLSLSIWLSDCAEIWPLMCVIFLCRNSLEKEKGFWEELLFHCTKFCLLIFYSNIEFFAKVKWNNSNIESSQRNIDLSASQESWLIVSFWNSFSSIKIRDTDTPEHIIHKNI
jgi:hypothetical protein